MRGAYYQAEMAGLVGKTEADYDRVQRAIHQMRRQGFISYERIVDNSRERRRVYMQTDLKSHLEEVYQVYRRDYWLHQPVQAEVWCEKDASTPIMNPVCQQYGVTFCAIRGFDSETFTYVSAQELLRVGKPAHIYYFGDHDPSGWFLAKGLQADLRSFGIDATVFHTAVHLEQVRALGLPVRQAKMKDSRYRAFVRHFGSDLSTEVDAIPPDQLQEMIRQCILQEIDGEAWGRISQVEELERHALRFMISEYLAGIDGTGGHLNAG